MNNSPRTISRSMAGILEELELENETYVTLKRLDELVQKNNVGTNATMVASRLKKSGWLLPTGQRGVWEFAPASVAGAYSKNDPLKEIKAFQIANPDTMSYLCLQTAAWAMGCADRVPSHKELAFDAIPRRHISEDILVYRYKPTLKVRDVRGVKCLPPESVIVHIATKPDQVKSWSGAMEWIPDIVYEINIDALMAELEPRCDSVKRRTGYLLQGMYPDAASEIMRSLKLDSKIRFGPRTKALRNDEKWMVADTILPLSPKEMETVK